MHGHSIRQDQASRSKGKQKTVAATKRFNSRGDDAPIGFSIGRLLCLEFALEYSKWTFAVQHGRRSAKEMARVACPLPRRKKRKMFENWKLTFTIYRRNTNEHYISLCVARRCAYISCIRVECVAVCTKCVDEKMYTRVCGPLWRRVYVCVPMLSLSTVYHCFCSRTYALSHFLSFSLSHSLALFLSQFLLIHIFVFLFLNPLLSQAIVSSLYSVSSPY